MTVGKTFEMTVSSIFADWQKPKTEKKYLNVSPPRFRGHANASWKLQTTLERFSSRTFKAEDYYPETIKTVRPAVVSLTGQPWNIPEKFAQKRYPSGYEFMIYLRHLTGSLHHWSIGQAHRLIVAFFCLSLSERSKGTIKLLFILILSGKETQKVTDSKSQHLWTLPVMSRAISDTMLSNVNTRSVGKKSARAGRVQQPRRLPFRVSRLAKAC